MITLKTLKDAIPMQVFEQVEQHLMQQKKKSFSKVRGICMYRYEGLKCAAGCLISEDEYKPNMEHNAWGNLVDYKIVSTVHRDLINALQNIHDNYKPSRWRGKLNVLKKKIQKGEFR